MSFEPLKSLKDPIFIDDFKEKGCPNCSCKTGFQHARGINSVMWSCGDCGIGFVISLDNNESDIKVGSQQGD